MARLADNLQIDEYSIVYFIKETLFCSSYRVLDTEGRSLFMKVFDMSSIPDSLLINGEPKEIGVCKDIDHKNIIKYVDSGIFRHEGTNHKYLVTDFFIGELLAESLLYNGLLTLEDKWDICKFPCLI